MSVSLYRRNARQLVGAPSGKRTSISKDDRETTDESHELDDLVRIIGRSSGAPHWEEVAGAAAVGGRSLFWRLSTRASIPDLAGMRTRLTKVARETSDESQTLTISPRI